MRVYGPIYICENVCIGIYYFLIFLVHNFNIILFGFSLYCGLTHLPSYSVMYRTYVTTTACLCFCNATLLLLLFVGPTASVTKDFNLHRAISNACKGITTIKPNAMATVCDFVTVNCAWASCASCASNRHKTSLNIGPEHLHKHTQQISYWKRMQLSEVSCLF